MPAFRIRIASSVFPALFVQTNARYLAGSDEWVYASPNGFHRPYLSKVPHSNNRLSVHGLDALNKDGFIFLVKFQGVALFPLEIRFPSPNEGTLVLTEGGNAWENKRRLSVMRRLWRE
jgi:hypothetical protein